jgi:DNA helicase HerA-like ATPase
MRPNPGLDIAASITELAIGEALVSLLDAKGSPGVTQRAWVLPPGSRLGPITGDERQALLKSSLVAGVYDQPIDRESAYEKLQARAASGQPAASSAGAAAAGQSAPVTGWGSVAKDILLGSTGPRGGQHDGLVQTMAKSAVRSVGTNLGRQILRGVLGGLFGGKK